jgi:hypothetical protein
MGADGSASQGREVAAVTVARADMGADIMTSIRRADAAPMTQRNLPSGMRGRLLRGGRTRCISNRYRDIKSDILKIR